MTKRTNIDSSESRVVLRRAHYALKKAIAIRPHHTQAWFQLSELYSMMELDDKAADALARAIESEVDFEI